MFDWSALPKDIKRIIFNFVKIENSVCIKKELEILKRNRYQLRFDGVLDELRDSKSLYRVYKIHSNSEVFSRSFLKNKFGQYINYEKKKKIGCIQSRYNHLDTLCYHCKNSSHAYCYPIRKIVKWRKVNCDKVVTSEIYLCIECYDILDILPDCILKGKTLDHSIYNIY